MRYAAALLVYFHAADDAWYLALGAAATAARCSERLEELWWAPTETFATPQAAVEASERFVPRPGNIVWQSYAVAVRPFLLDEESLVLRGIISWETAMPEWMADEEAA